MRFAFLFAVAFTLLSASSARADVVVKDTLDSENFNTITAFGGYISPDVFHEAVEGRTHLGYLPIRRGIVAEVRLNFIAADEGTSTVRNELDRSYLFDISIAQYGSYAEAESDPRRVDAFFSQQTQWLDIFDVPVGMTSAGILGGQSIASAKVYQAVYDMRPFGLEVNPGETNYLGVSATGHTIGIDYQLQRSSDAGPTLGSSPDFMSGPPVFFGDGLAPMSDFYADSIQNSVRITITNFGDARDGDYNGDGTVDAADFTVWRDNYGATSGPGLIADGNVDGVVDASDYAVWREYYGETVPGSAPAGSLTVPEPTAAVLLAGSVLLTGATFSRKLDKTTVRNIP